MADVSIIILNYNDSVTTMKLVDSFLLWKRQQHKLHFIVVDNRSKDDSFACLCTKYGKVDIVDVIQSEKNGGYSYGNNFGAKFAIEKYHSDFIAIANPDIEIDENDFISLLETFIYSEKLAACSPIMKSIDDNYSIYSQKLPTYRDDLMACFNSSSSDTIIRNKFNYLSGSHNAILTEMLPGCFFVIRADVFQKIGMLDEGVFLFCEERILGSRLKQNGYLAAYRNDLFFVHAHSVSIKKVYDTLKTWRILMNSRFYYEKKYNRCNIIELFILKVCMKVFLLGLGMKMKAYSLKERLSRNV